MHRIQDQIISMDGIQSINGNQAESNDIVIAAVPRESEGSWKFIFDLLQGLNLCSNSQ